MRSSLFFLCQLLLRMQTEFFGAGSAVAGPDEPADRLMIIVSGRVRIYLQGLAGRRRGLLLTLGPGCVLAHRRISSQITPLPERTTACWPIRRA